MKAAAASCVCKDWESRIAVSPRDLQVAECLKNEVYDRCHTTTGLRLMGVVVSGILEGSPADECGQIQVV